MCMKNMYSGESTRRLSSINTSILRKKENAPGMSLVGH